MVANINNPVMLNVYWTGELFPMSLGRAWAETRKNLVDRSRKFEMYKLNMVVGIQPVDVARQENV